MPGISSVYQLEQEMHPYLSVEFLPNGGGKNEPPGVILIAGDKVIRRNYTFEDPNDIEEMRKLIWECIRKLHNPPDITDEKGCIKDFRKTETNRVIQGWQAKKRQLASIRCCKVIKQLVARTFAEQFIKHERYRYSTRDQQNRRICKKVRFEECGNNYAPNTELFRRCVSEVNWLCNNGYPFNKRTEIVVDYREKLKNAILKYLKDNNMKVNKSILDTILSAGFFERVRNRMGNKYTSYGSVEHAVNEIEDDYGYFSKLIEGYDKNQKNTTSMSTTKTHFPFYKLILVLILAIILIYYFI